MRRFFINSQAIDGQIVVITGSDVHHIRNVLRLGRADKITVIDESATEYEVELDQLTDEQVSGRIAATRRPPAPSVRLALFQGLPKGTKFDRIVEQATELGADRISPVMMERSIPRPESGAKPRITRWRRLAEAAAKQSRRQSLPTVDGPLAWNDFLAALAGYDLAVLFWEGATEPVDQALARFSGTHLAVIIGPEGGLAAKEVAALVDAGARTAWLGPRILRTETAPVAALAVVNHLLNR